MNLFHLYEHRLTYDTLLEAYREKHRHYHTTEHITACLKHLDKVHNSATRPHEIELALWFHDAIYHPYRKDNEVQSAQWANQFLSDNAVDELIIKRVNELIMLTIHTDAKEVRLTGDHALMIDIDLSILGSCEEIYRVYERNVRKEYRFVPYFLYRKKRKEILQMFLEQPVIYQTEYFYHLLEKQARKNIQKALLSL